MKKVIACLLCIVTMISTLQIFVPAYEGQPLGENIAFHKNVEVSNDTNSNDENKVDFLTDGKLDTRYQSAVSPKSKENPYEDNQTWIMDLGKEYEIDKVVLYWESAAAKKYEIYISSDKKKWDIIGTENDGKKGRLKYEFSSKNARYVKILLQERVMEDYGYCMYEWQVFTVGSVENKEVPNLALSATASASSVSDNNEAQNAIDGNEDTMWRSAPLFQDPTVKDEDKANENITLKWNSRQSFDTITILWSGGYMKGYKFQISDNGKDWEDIYEVKNGTSADNRTIRLDKTVTTSYLRMQGVTYGEYCFEVKEIAVYDQSNILVENINLSSYFVKLNINNPDESTAKLEYNLAPANTSQTEVVWKSSNSEVAEVKDGVIKGKSSGKAIITIESKDNPNVKKSCTVYVAEELDKSNVKATKTDKNIYVKWSQVEHAGYYILVRRNINTGIENEVYRGAATDFEDKELSSGKYIYFVKAVVDENYSEANLYSDSKSDASNMVEIPEPVTGVEIVNEFQNVSMFVGDSVEIEYGIIPANATNTNVIFKSMNEKIATVDHNGVVTGVSKGNTKVIVTTEEGHFTAECTVNVDGIDIKGLNRVGEKEIYMKPENTHQLSVDIIPNNATERLIQWSSSDSSVAVVDENGLVTAKDSGKTIITAKANNGLQVEYFVIVENPVKSISLNNYSIKICQGKTFKLVAAITPVNASDRKVKWISSNDTIATVENDGTVIGKKIGVAYISAISNDGNVVATCTVTVSKQVVIKPPKVKLKYTKINGNKITIKWTKTTKATGYVVYMKTDSGKYKQVKLIKKNKITKCVIKRKKGKTLFFKVRTYKLDGSNKVYGPYSNVKKIKVKQ